MSLSLLCILTWTLTWIQTNVCTVSENKKTCMGIKTEDSNHLISQNIHHINHNKGINKWSGRGLIWIDFHAYCNRDLSVSFDVSDMTRAQYRVDDPSACTTAWYHILMLLNWPAKNKIHNSTQKNMFFIDSSWPLHGVNFATFQLRTYPIFWNTALSLME